VSTSPFLSIGSSFLSGLHGQGLQPVAASRPSSSSVVVCANVGQQSFLQRPLEDDDWRTCALAMPMPTWLLRVTSDRVATQLPGDRNGREAGLPLGDVLTPTPISPAGARYAAAPALVLVQLRRLLGVDADGCFRAKGGTHCRRAAAGRDLPIGSVAPGVLSKAAGFGGRLPRHPEAS
jgi:hypothetical protein